MPNKQFEDRVISFAWTSAPLLAGHKTVTRRDWFPKYADQFKAGDVVDAYDKTRKHGGRKIATIKLLDDPKLEAIADEPDSDYWAEGFSWLHSHPRSRPRQMMGVPVRPDTFRFDSFQALRERLKAQRQWTIRFEVVSVEPDLPKPLTSSRLLETEIGMTALYWGNRLTIARPSLTQIDLNTFRQELVKVISGDLDGQPWQLLLGQIYGVSDGRLGDYLRYACERAGIADARDQLAIFGTRKILTSFGPGGVSVMDEDGGISQLWTCRPPHWDADNVFESALITGPIRARQGSLI